MGNCRHARGRLQSSRIYLCDAMHAHHALAGASRRVLGEERVLFGERRVGCRMGEREGEGCCTIIKFLVRSDAAAVATMTALSR